MKKPRLWLIAAGLALAASLIWWGLSLAFVPGATVARATTGTAVQAVSGTARVAPLVRTDVTATATGFLDQRLAGAGDTVEKGQLLARIAPGELPYQLRAAELELRGVERLVGMQLPVEVQLAQAERALRRALELSDAGAATATELEARQAEVEALQAQANRERIELESRQALLQNRVEQLRAQREALDITAPVTGTITAVHAYPGSRLETGEPILTLISDAFRVLAEVNQENVPVVRGSKSAIVRFFAYGAEQFEARIVHLLPSSDETTQRFRVILELAEPPEGLIPGLTGEASFIGARREDALLIPRRALKGRDVLVLENGRVERRRVTAGFVSLTQAEILEGLQPGDLVIIDDLEYYREGDRARVCEIVER